MFLKILALDTETELFPPLGTRKVNLRYPCPPLVCISYYDNFTEAAGVLEAHQITTFQDMLKDAYERDYVLAFHNAAFDMGVLHKYCPAGVRYWLKKFLVEQRIVDTRVMYFLRYPDPNQRVCSLAYLSAKYLNIELDKGETRLSFQRGQRLTDEQRQYAELDAVVTGQLATYFARLPLGTLRAQYGVQMPVATERTGVSVKPDNNFSAAAAWKAFHLSSVGMELDLENLRNHHERLAANVAAFGRMLHDRGLADYTRPANVEPRAEPDQLPEDWSRRWEYDVLSGRLMRVVKNKVISVPAHLKKNLTEIRALAYAFEAEHDLKLPRSDKTHMISLKRDDWVDYVAHDALPPDLSLFFDYEKHNKYLSTFTKPLVESGARRVHSDYYIPGAATGRWSCTKINLQQVWKGIRDIYRAKEGCVLVAADYPTLELYTLAQTLYGMGIEGPLLETLNNQEDIHTKTAEEVLGDAKLRQGAKALNFGLPGGMGARRFAAHAKTLGLDWEPDDARRLRLRWLNHYWDVKQYLRGFDVSPWYFYRGQQDWESKRAWLIDTLDFEADEVDNDELSSFDILRRVQDGRHFTVTLASGRVIPDRTYTMSSNCFFQGLGADIITLAFNKVCEALEEFPGIRVVAVVHDSIVLEAPNNPVDQKVASDILEQSMLAALRTFCPNVRPPARIEPEISERWN